jgi:low affinity Fe/Cu permease
MNKITAITGLALIAFSAVTFAQDARSDAAANAERQQRMDEAYAAHRDGSSAHPVAAIKRDTREAGHEIHEDTREAGHAIHKGVRATGHAVHQGVRATGHAVHQGVRATGHAVHQGVRATGHAIHEGVDKLTGH